MKKLVFSLAVVLFAAAAAAAEGPKLGLGASFGGAETAIHVPYNLSGNLRLDPFVGLVRTKVTDNTGATEVVNTDTTFDVGVGAYYLMAAGQNVELYAGGKVGVGFVFSKVKDGG